MTATTTTDRPARRHDAPARRPRGNVSGGPTATIPSHRDDVTSGRSR